MFLLQTMACQEEMVLPTGNVPARRYRPETTKTLR